MDERLFEQRVREAATAATALSAPAESWNRIAARIQAGEVVLLPTAASRAARTMRATRGLRVAGLVLLAGAAAAAAALPASPVRKWLEDVFTSNGVVEPARTAIEPVNDAPTAPPATESATTLVLEPSNGRIVLALEAPQQGTSLRVRFVDGGEPEVRATGAAASAQFRSAAGRLTVVNASGGLVLTIPRATAQVRVEVDGRPYLTKENGQIRVLAPAADTAESEILLQIRH